GDDTLTLDLGNGDPLPFYGTNFDGGAGNDTLQIVGAGSSVPVLADASHVWRTNAGDGMVNRANVESINVAGGTMTASADLGGVNLTVGDQGFALLGAPVVHVATLNVQSGGRVQLAAGGNTVLLAD